MRTLYVSDLDGTLFNKEKKISSRSAELINECMKKGLEFTVATARMPYGCDYRLEELSLNVPGILTNGVFLYDFVEKEYLHVEKIEKEASRKVLEIFESVGLSCFVYVYREGTISIYYGDRELEKQTQYYSERALESCAEVRLVNGFGEVPDRDNIVYLALTGEDDVLHPLLESLENIEGIHYAYYLNIYNGLYCLEIFSEKASKQNALKRLKKMGSYEQVVVFGDNLNDLSMIEIADRSYAPENALKEVKERVTAVIDGCNEDGVAKFLYQEWENIETSAEQK